MNRICRRYFGRIATCFLFFVQTSTTIAAGNIYVAYAEDGTPRFSSQAYDKSYSLYLRGSVSSSPTAIKTRSLKPEQRKEILPLIQQTAEKHGVDPALVSALIDIESGFNPRALSPKGAMGLMQLIPQTAARYGVTDAYDIQQNLNGGTRYLKDLLTLHKGNIALALASYNAGENSVNRHQQRIPPYGETMLYVPMVLAKMQSYQQQFKIAAQ